MAVVMIVAEQRSAAVVTGPLNPPSGTQIAAAFGAARLRVSGPPRDIDGGWLGGIRVTRSDSVALGALREFRTTAAGVYGWPAAGPWSTAHAPQPDLVEALRAGVSAHLNADVPGSWEVRAVAYAPAAHGALSWWASSAAAVTQTREVYPGLAGLVDVSENPTGPTSDATHPSTLGGAARDAAAGLGQASALPWIAAAVIAVAVAAVAWQLGPVARLAGAAGTARRERSGR